MAKEKVKKEKPVNNHPNKIGIKEAAGYTVAEAGNMFNLTYISSYLKIFMTDVLKIQPMTAAIMFIITRLWDCINDPIWGAMVAKKAPHKDGKFRPYLKWVAIPLGVSTILCFMPYDRMTQNTTILLIICYITYVFYGMMYIGMNIPFGSLASVITDDPNGRNLLSTFRSIGSGVGGAVVKATAVCKSVNFFAVCVAPFFYFCKCRKITVKFTGNIKTVKIILYVIHTFNRAYSHIH